MDLGKNLRTLKALILVFQIYGLLKTLRTRRNPEVSWISYEVQKDLHDQERIVSCTPAIPESVGWTTPGPALLLLPCLLKLSPENYKQRKLDQNICSEIASYKQKLQANSHPDFQLTGPKLT